MGYDFVIGNGSSSRDGQIEVGKDGTGRLMVLMPEMLNIINLELVYA